MFFITNKSVDFCLSASVVNVVRLSISIILCFPRREVPSCSSSSSSFQLANTVEGLDKVKQSNSKAGSISQDGIRLSAKRRMMKNIDRVNRQRLSLM